MAWLYHNQRADALALRSHRDLRFAVLLFVLLLASCESNTLPPWSAESMQLHPLSPITYLFDSEAGTNRIDYFFIDSDYISISDARFRAALQKLAETAHSNLTEKNYGISSIYVYRRTSKLNHEFSGDAEALRGVFDNDIVSYSRWNKGQLDIFYLLDDGKVVFNLLTNESVDPPWEFD
ncbi:MAG: hypothetical protein ABW068_08970 [Candidatus Thiodiazotropha sp.]